jgi:rubrerythrin
MEEKSSLEKALLYSNAELGAPQEEKSQMEKMLDSFEAHVSSERATIQEYQEIASRTKNETIRFLVNLILEEEAKHHRLLQAMTQTLRESLTWQSRPDALHFSGELGIDKEEIRRATERFLAEERDGIRRCKVMKKESKKLYYGLFEVLFDVMIRDGQKHEQLLKYINKTLTLF